MDKLVKCKACGEEIAKSAKTCPKCGAKKKSHIGIGILCLVLLFAVIGAFSQSRKESLLTEELLTEIEDIISRDYEQYKVIVDDGQLNISVQKEGLAQIAMLAKTQKNGAFYELWQDAKMTAKRKTIAIEGLINSKVGQDIPVTIRVLNDENPENIMLSYYGEELLYDIVDE